VENIEVDYVRTWNRGIINPYSLSLNPPSQIGKIVMLKLKINLYATLRDKVGQKEIDLPFSTNQTVGDILHVLVKRNPELNEDIWNADGSLAGHVVVILDGRDIRHLDGVNTPLSEGDWLDVFPPVGGGI
jgi:molybdopterin synthase sulfur carrier subunit